MRSVLDSDDKTDFWIFLIVLLAGMVESVKLRYHVGGNVNVSLLKTFC